MPITRLHQPPKNPHAVALGTLGGRPPQGPESITARLSTRLTPSMDAAFRQSAKAHGHSPALWLRRMIEAQVAADRGRGLIPTPDQQETEDDADEVGDEPG